MIWTDFRRLSSCYFCVIVLTCAVVLASVETMRDSLVVRLRRKSILQTFIEEGGEFFRAWIKSYSRGGQY